jgi:3-carboxy-cis,cis-muconate cycloisomerase
MSVRLIESMATTEPLNEIFSDVSLIQAMLDFEVALARAQSQIKMIPSAAAVAIARAARAEDYDAAAMARDTLRAGTPGLPLVKALRKKVQQEDPAAADFVHWGATSQDIADTALVLLLKKAVPLIDADLVRIEKSLRRLAAKHKKTILIGRTLLQPAPPVTLALKAAGWLASIRRGRARLNHAASEALVIQFGGASGTLAAMGNRGIQVGELMAKQLGLTFPDGPWHAHRDRLAELVCACGILTGSLGKMARDISLLMQSEVGEVAEPFDDGRGGSSTMPQKRNPIASAIALAAASRVPGLTAAFLSQMVQEHERAVGGWQAEWPTIAAVIQAAGVAAASMAEAAEGLIVNPARMKDNLDATHGSIFAEKAALLLSEKTGREAAHLILERATDPARLRNRTLSQTLAEMPEAQLEKNAFAKLEEAQDYLGSADEFTNRLSRSKKNRARRGK